MTTDYVAFANWLRAELIERGMRQADLARATGIDAAYISKVLNVERQASVSFCRELARVLEIPPEEVLRRAGLLPAKPEVDTMLARALSDFLKLGEDERQEILELMAVKIRRRNRKKGLGTADGRDEAII